MKFIEHSLLLAGVLVLTVSAQTTDYCSSTLCSNQKHIACGNNGKFSSNCATNARIIPMTTNLKQALLNKQNSLRNKIASGNLKGYQPAVRMATIQWDAELAKLAELNVKQCEMKHDACRNTNKFHYAGQNLAYSWWSGMTQDVKTVALQQVQSWFDEYKYGSMQYIIKYSDPSNGKVIGHFTQMVKEQATHMGCGIVREDKNSGTAQYLACNYAMTNILDRYIYRAGKRASKCTTGVNPKYKFLCSVKEKYAVNQP